MHQPVLPGDVLGALRIRPDGIYVDATLGRGGHSQAILQQLGADGRLLALDRDPEAVRFGQVQFGGDSRVSIVQVSFSMLEAITKQFGIRGRVDGLLLDLGVSSPQLDDAGRGFSFLRDGPLDMRMDPGAGISASRWLMSAKEREISDVLRKYGEERHAPRIARAIVEARKEAPIRTTGHLAAIVSAANPAWEKNKHPATRVFQAIRIFINRELDELAECLEQSLNVLAAGGRLAIISFHSLEDRIVKRFIRDQARGDRFPANLPVTASALQPRLRAVGKAIRPSADEVSANPRARSAVLRVAERLP